MNVLIIDDDLDMCTLLSRFLTKNGYVVDVAHSAAKGIAKFDDQNFDIVLCDFRLGDKDGKDVLMEIKKRSPQTIVVIITGYSDIKIAVDVIKLGAYDYITKPLIPDEVLSVLKNATSAPLENKVGGMDTAPNKPGKKANAPKLNTTGDFLVGESPKTKDLYKQIEIVAPTNYSIILYGESGTGKEVIAKTIHQMSDRKEQPFIAMDCGTLSKELSGSELFGHVKGAFTGALSDKEGHFELANGGTLFLDEVADLPLAMQVKLLRAIQEKTIRAIGDTKEVPVDIRILSATHKDLSTLVEQGTFRQDLYYRINVIELKLPTLNARRSDIPVLTDHFLTLIAKEWQLDTPPSLTSSAFALLQQIEFAGNVR